MNRVSPASLPQGPGITFREGIAETPRLRLRQLEQPDLPFMVQLFGSLKVMRFSLTGPLAPPQAAQILDRFLESYTTQRLSQWAVIEKSTEELIGLCGFLLRDPINEPEWELAYRFLPCYWGQGYATEAAIACRDLAFQTPGVHILYAFVEESHISSVRVLEKVGFERQCATQLQGVPVLKYILRHSDDS